MASWTRTDTRGRFGYFGLQEGRYTLRVRAERYVAVEYGQLSAADAPKDIRLEKGVRFTANMRLWRSSAMEGTLLDEFGEPAPNITVQLSRREFAAGRHRLVPVGGLLQQAVTDDLGHYRIPGISAGSYYVVGLSGAYTDRADVGGFAATYYPGTDESNAAVAVSVAAGADSTATFQLTAARTFAVSGRILDAMGAPSRGRSIVTLSTPDRLLTQEMNVIRATASADGTFVMRNVPEGSYTLQALGSPSDAGGPPAFGWTSVNVIDHPEDDVVVRLGTGTRLRGKVVLDDEQSAPPRRDEIRVSAVPVQFDSSPLLGGPTPSRTFDDLTFEMTHLTGMRRILVSVSNPHWSLRRITLDGNDVTDAPLDVGDNDTSGVVVYPTTAVTRVTGTVTDGRGPIASYSVLIFSADPTKWGDRSRFVAVARPTQTGEFDLRGMPSEDYLAIALPRLEGNEWQDPEFLRQVRSEATSLSLGDGESKALTLILRRGLHSIDREQR